ncbi:MAG: hypothetical protein WC494_02960 [Candidatus Pacearchaeota archaeon]
MKSNKKAVMGETVFMMYRLILITLIALAVLGVSSVFYSHYILVRPAEALIMTRQIADCFTLEEKNFEEVEERKVLSFCGYEEKEIERFFVKVNFLDNSGNIIKSVYQGDDGAMWVKDLYEKQKENVKSIEKYAPGYYLSEYPLYNKNNGEEIIMKVEVLVNE